jgi:hypothetical protein
MQVSFVNEAPDFWTSLKNKTRVFFENCFGTLKPAGKSNGHLISGRIPFNFEWPTLFLGIFESKPDLEWSGR